MTNQMKIDLIDLDQPLLGYTKFISCWVCRLGDVVFIVDPGPRNTIAPLLQGLSSLGVDKIDYVLLTHIHLDHGGGSAQVLEAFPTARLYCHEKGIPHMLDPTRLWSGSKQVLGTQADLYEKPTPVDARRFATTQELRDKGIVPIPTPGHASHHLAFLFDDLLFVGEALGICVQLNGNLYLRPSAPPPFHADLAITSINRLLSLDHEPKQLLFAHYGRISDPFSWCVKSRNQILLWQSIIAELKADKSTSASLHKRFFEALMVRDSLFGQGKFDALPREIKKREKQFLIDFCRQNPQLL